MTALECTKCQTTADYNQPSCWTAGYDENGEPLEEDDVRKTCNHNFEVVE